MRRMAAAAAPGGGGFKVELCFRRNAESAKGQQGRIGAWRCDWAFVLWDSLVAGRGHLSEISPFSPSNVAHWAHDP